MGALGTTTLSSGDFAIFSTLVYSHKNQIYVSNVLSATEVKVYSINGALVKSFVTAIDTDFQLEQSGVYFVNTKTEAGEKSVKVIVN